jgi:transitional endoplasmic reticulum ATPase
MQQIREKKDVIDSATHGDAMDPEQLDSFQITMENFRCALDTSVPSALREIAVQAPTEIWHDINICGLEEVRREIRESFQYPVSHPEKYIKYGVSPSKGILLYGPPGTGKSLLAKAIADDCNANFINIKASSSHSVLYEQSTHHVSRPLDFLKRLGVYQKSLFVIFLTRLVLLLHASCSSTTWISLLKLETISRVTLAIAC